MKNKSRKLPKLPYILFGCAAREKNKIIIVKHHKHPHYGWVGEGFCFQGLNKGTYSYEWLIGATNLLDNKEGETFKILPVNISK